MPPNEDVVQAIWSASKGKYAFQATKNQRGVWTDFPNRATDDMEILDQPHGFDLYFSALRSSKPTRSNGNFVGAALLFADLDPVDPRGLSIIPSIAWETSPGSYQAVWFLDAMMTNYHEWSGLNQRMTRYTKADPGGWMGSKVLRWPGSLNWKRATESSVPVGRLLWADDTEYEIDELLLRLPSVAVARPVDGDHPDLFPPSEISGMRLHLRGKHWLQLGLRGRSMITRVMVPDRSLFLAKAARQLISEGLTAEETFHLLWVQPYCKWRTDRNAPEVLWSEVRKAVDAVEQRTSK